ncbi:lycopene beta-cyclase CrtY [Rhizobium sp. YIM 134829]|uniref:lycopene beta-cyclase CrtY n=1 Tax=Rhizobium sp. YIM 134829 TaxID=3390453 RepID=UPI00397CD703
MTDTDPTPHEALAETLQRAGAAGPTAQHFERAGSDRPPLVLVGAGLSSALIACCLARRHPNTRILILEGTGRPFGVHTWSFHDADVAEEEQAWLSPLVAHRWSGQEVRFRAHRRYLPSGYASLTSDSVFHAVCGLDAVTLKTHAAAAHLAEDHVVLSDGQRIEAACVIDCRGFRPSSSLVLGFQKFLGLEVELAAPHDVAHPIIMDATVDQKDGYRFVYVLPLSTSRLLIEDTRYADGPDLDQQALGQDIEAYATGQGFAIRQVLRREEGVLPITLAHDAKRFWSEVPCGIPQAGLRAALFHPTTGYSLPDAVRLARLVAEHWPASSPELSRVIEAFALERHRAQRFYRLLNRMLFLAAPPAERHRVLERFYRLPTPLIERFYAGRTTARDAARILTGKPPVPLLRALACLREAPLLGNGSP